MSRDYKITDLGHQIKVRAEKLLIETVTKGEKLQGKKLPNVPDEKFRKKSEKTTKKKKMGYGFGVYEYEQRGIPDTDGSTEIDQLMFIRSLRCLN